MDETGDSTSSTREDELVFRERRGPTLIRLVLLLIGCVGAARFESSFAPYAAVLAVVVVGWTIWLLRRRERFAIKYASDGLETPAGHTFSLAAIRAVAVGGPFPPSYTVSDVQIDLGQNWVPIFTGALEESKQLARFLELGLQERDARAAEANRKVSEPPVAAPALRALPTSLSEWRAALNIARPGSNQDLFCAVVKRGHWTDPELHEVKDYIDLIRGFDQGFAGLAWDKRKGAAAVELVADVLRKELAYGYLFMSVEDSLFFARAFLGLFGQDAACFAPPPDARMSRDANFDRGVVIVDEERVGIIWIESNNPGR